MKDNTGNVSSVWIDCVKSEPEPAHQLKLIWLHNGGMPVLTCYTSGDFHSTKMHTCTCTYQINMKSVQQLFPVALSGLIENLILLMGLSKTVWEMFTFPSITFYFKVQTAFSAVFCRLPGKGLIHQVY